MIQPGSLNLKTSRQIQEVIRWQQAQQNNTGTGDLDFSTSPGATSLNINMPLQAIVEVTGTPRSDGRYPAKIEFYDEVNSGYIQSGTNQPIWLREANAYPLFNGEYYIAFGTGYNPDTSGLYSGFLGDARSVYTTFCPPETAGSSSCTCENTICCSGIPSTVCCNIAYMSGAGAGAGCQCYVGSVTMTYTSASGSGPPNSSGTYWVASGYGCTQSQSGQACSGGINLYWYCNAGPTLMELSYEIIGNGYSAAFTNLSGGCCQCSGSSKSFMGPLAYYGLIGDNFAVDPNCDYTLYMLATINTTPCDIVGLGGNPVMATNNIVQLGASSITGNYIANQAIGANAFSQSSIPTF